VRGDLLARAIDEILSGVLGVFERVLCLALGLIELALGLARLVARELALGFLRLAGRFIFEFPWCTSQTGCGPALCHG
jgi:hypothetical protein